MHDLLMSLQADFLKIGIRESITGPLASTVFGSVGGSGGGILGKAFSAVRNVIGFESGGIMTNRWPVPLRKYAGGGIANSPQLAMFGEGSTPEAYVPVPNGRIPVELKGGGGNTITTVVNVSMPVTQGNSGGGGSRWPRHGRTEQ